MIGTLYTINARYVADTTGAQTNVERLAATNDRAARSVDGLASRFSRMGGVAIASLAGVATLGIGVLTRKIVDLNREAADAQIGVASVLSINGLGTFNQGMTRAKGLMERFKKAAITSPGESRDLQNIFTRTAPQLARFNPNDAEITQFTTRGLAAAFTLMGGDVDLTGDQLSQIMGGQAGSDNKLFQSIRAPLMKNAGVKATEPTKAVEEFNKLTAKNPQKVFEALQKTLGSLDQANMAFANTMTGRLGSLSELSNNWLKDMSGPLFERVNGMFGKLIDYADKSSGKLDELASTVGRKLADGFDRAQRLALALVHNLKTIVMLGAAPGLYMAASALSGSGALASVGGLGGYAGRAGGYGRAAAGSVGRGVAAGARGILGAPGALLSFAGDALFGNTFASAVGGGPNMSRGARLARGASAARAGFMPGLRSGLSSAGALLMSDPATHLRALEARRQAGGGLLRMGAASVGAPAVGLLKGAAVGLSGLSAVLVPLIVVLGMVVGTFRVLKDGANEATQFLKTSWSELRIVFDTIAGQFGAGGGFGGAVRSFVDWLGTGVVGVLGVAVKVVAEVANGFSWLIVVLKGLAYGLNSIYEVYNKKGLRGLTGDSIGNAFSLGLIQAEKERKASERSAYQREAERQREAAKLKSDQEYTKLAEEAMKKAKEKEQEKLANGTKPAVTVMNNIQVITEADPDKIAISLDKMNASSITDALRSIEGIPGF